MLTVLRALAVLLFFLLPSFAFAGQRAGELCKPGVECDPGLVCTPRVGQGSICAAPTGTTVPTTVKPPTPTTVPTSKPPTTIITPGPCNAAGKLCGTNHDPCCAGLTCVANHCAATGATVPPTTPTTVPKPVTSTTLPAGGPSGVAAIRPTAQDVSIKTPANAYYTWYRGKVATQPVRDAMQQAVVSVFIPKALRYARSNKACEGAVNWALSGQGNYDKINAKLANLYENLSSPWSVPPQGRNYSFDHGILERIQSCSLAKADACAANPLMTIEMRDLLDLHVAAGRCVRGATFFVFAPSEPFSSQRAGLAPVNKKLGFKPTGELLALLRAAVGAHGAASDCSGNFAPIGGSVDKALRAYETAAYASGTTEEDKLNRLHFAQLKRFDGFCDSTANGNPQGWTDAQCCAWKALQHRFMMTWQACEEQGDWLCARNADSDHVLAHQCANLKNDEMDVRFSFACPDDPHDCPISNCRDALARLMPVAR